MEIIREKHTLDASDRPAGRLASETAILLMGKHKVSFQSHQDMGDFVEIENVNKLKFTGKKLENKVYYKHSLYPGGIKSQTLAKFFKERPEELFRKIVMGMLPKNKLRKDMIKRLTFK
ncbi:MAG: 50S ribosomal protein L13 [Candidatus Komeilibacteria bacterium CG10_big_fil_rev_8_21_14_0_10_41_13]|uniref:Large ribosomal subunit protein uL13 n=1 Tax=Candidatus Komeilibacteria bacterium CG10_big_fil_rev_8_21_14_0_10_41_13 TaxID=1974476 RepID=A0A2M6WDA5_9BACT|nr:MAG: 50S ribosomal protein L13 [Candidatus Komeilibacteria bacterium CG10_big_fil_rev_8_21_14_0_10_41_13]